MSGLGTPSPVASAPSNNPFPVKPTGFLIGSFLACCLYGAHISQIYRYARRFSDPLKLRLLVFWVWTLSTCQLLIIIGSAWKYFVDGIYDPTVWGEFWWPLSFQDGLIPFMAFTAQLYFGERAWRLYGQRRWVAKTGVCVAILTLALGIALAVTARLWSEDPWGSAYDFSQRKIGVPSQVVAMTWLGLSAIVDGTLTFALLYKFIRARNNMPTVSQGLAWRLVALTLETVLLTHIVGATMFIIFAASPPATRTDSNMFWVLLESITELYALSILFTLNSRRRMRSGDVEVSVPFDPEYRTQSHVEVSDLELPSLPVASPITPESPERLSYFVDQLERKL